MDPAGTRNISWKSDSKAPPYCASCSRIRFHMMCDKDMLLLVTIECSDGNITIKTGDERRVRTHFILVNCIATAINVNQNCIKIDETEDYDLCRHIVTVTYTLASGIKFDIVINEDGWMNVKSGLDVLMELYGIDNKLKYSMHVADTYKLIANDTRYEYMSKVRGVSMKPLPYDVTKKRINSEVRRNVDRSVSANTIQYNNTCSCISMNIFGMSIFIKLSGGIYSVSAKDNATGVIRNFKLAEGAHEFKGAYLQDCVFIMGGSVSKNITGYCIAAVNYFTLQFTDVKVTEGRYE